MPHPDYTYSKPDWSLIPDYMIGGLRRWIENGIKPGDFLCAVLQNDLREACARADDTNQRRLYDYIKFLYCYAPSDCYGSPLAFENWKAHKGLDWPEVYGGDGSARVLVYDPDAPDATDNDIIEISVQK